MNFNPFEYIVNGIGGIVGELRGSSWPSNSKTSKLPVLSLRGLAWMIRPCLSRGSRLAR
jgi:hypothetical protein